MDVMELTDSSDDDLPAFEELLQQSSSQKSSSSQKTVKRLESMKLEDDGFEMTGTPPLFLFAPRSRLTKAFSPETQGQGESKGWRQEGGIGPQTS